MFIGVFDADSLGDDDALGRVEIPLASLHADTVYDVWAPLQNSPFTQHMHKCAYHYTYDNTCQG